MKTSANGIKLIQGFEGLSLKAYQDSVGVWTIGYGHTGPEVTLGLVITQAQADALLARDLSRFESGVTRLVQVPLNQNQFDALVCFSFNLGLGALQGSTLLRLLNAGDYAGAAGQFPRWNKAGGKELTGLTRRRVAEQALFLGK
ncbi:lysozyme [Chromobacterium haemolyticum]|uniref:Lysozyme n=1 Tax=Chromobacterium haemolyticum TaxID=394935 RepID=A0A1W0D662_9NEIS|nr:lysozyme [Chromobacterium haemolyticum]OQS42352.1 muraminidase [Chromobacterium haemolyticum]